MSILERNLREIIEDCTINLDNGTLTQSTINLFKFLKVHYFLLNGDPENESLQLLDSLKVICFLILISNDDKSSKINAFVNTILEETKGDDVYLKDISDNDISMSDNTIELQFHKKEPKTLDVLSVLLSSAILPFIYYHHRGTREPEFDRFVKFATTNK